MSDSKCHLQLEHVLEAEAAGLVVVVERSFEVEPGLVVVAPDSFDVERSLEVGYGTDTTDMEQFLKAVRVP